MKYYIILLCMMSASCTVLHASDNIHGGTQNGIVGKISDEYQVTPSGQFNYELALSVPSGTGGIAPQLSIVYNSSNKEGLIGYGFDLSGISLISRSPENLYRDGKADIVRFDATDRFSLDGIRLSLSKTISGTKREYRTELDNYSKIIAEGDAVNPSKFTVYTKEGLIREFKSAKELFGASGNNLYWLETKVTDTKGNYYSITYLGNASANEYRPSKIEYTGNSNTGLSPYASVQFSYLNNVHAPKYISGIKVQRNNCISSIVMYYGNQQVKKYDISYTKSRSSLFLKQIVECVGQEKKNPTSFTWNNGGAFAMTTPVNASSSPDFKNRQVVLGDFNGDGMTDFLSRANNDSKDLSYTIHLSSGTSFKKMEGSFIIPNDRNSDMKSIREVRSGDFNGDGYDDIIIERERSSFYTIDLYLSHVSGTNISLVYNKNVVPAIRFMHHMQVMDINCDGAADVFIYNANYGSDSYLTLISSSSDSNITPLSSIYEGTLSNDAWYGLVSFPDLDGDGTCEILNTHEKDVSNLYKIQPNGELQVETGLSIGGNSYFCSGDFNGDGKTDILTMGTTQNENIAWEVNFATGIVSSTQNLFNANSVTKLFSPKEKRMYVVDIDGDGYDDIYVLPTTTKNNQKTPIDIYINNGTGKAFAHYSGVNVLGTDKRNYGIGDFNGDGKADFICYMRPKDGTTGYDIYLQGNNANNLLSSVKDGLGNTINIEYQRLTNKNTHTRGSNASYPMISMSCSWPVVSRVSSSNGIGGSKSIEYKYKNALFHKRGRGMLCFEEMTTKDGSTNCSTTSQYEVLSDEMVPALKSVISKVGTKMISQTNYLNKIYYHLHKDKKEVSFSILPYRTIEIFYEYSSGVKVSDVTTDMEYDNYGNVTKITSTNDGRKVTTTNTYSNDETKWHIGRLTKSNVTKTDDKQAITVSSEYKYDSASGLLTSESFEPGQPMGYNKKYEYDSYGNILKDIVSPNDQCHPSQTHITEYTANGRYKIKSIDAEGLITTSEVDAIMGVEKKMTDPNGLITVYEHDVFGNITSVKSPLQTVKTITAWSNGHEYAPANAVYYVKTESAGTPTVWEFFDGLGRSVRKATQSLNNKVVFSDTEYNGKGQIARSSLPYYKGENICWNNIYYDEAGRIIKEEDPQGNYTTYNYNGLATTINDKLHHTQKKIYNLKGELVESIDANGSNILYQYDVNGKCIEVKGPRTTIRTEYDKYGNKIKLIDPDLGTIEYGYNAMGELIWQKDSRGTSTFEYDSKGRLIEETRPDFTYQFIYDTKWKGVLSKSLCSNGIDHEYFYDQYGRTIKETETIANEAFTTEYAYNINNKLDIIKYPSGFSIKNEYSPEGYHIAVTSNGGANSKVYWRNQRTNALGQIEQESLGNNLTINTLHNQLGQITNIKAGQFFDLSYGYDAKGNLINRTDSLLGSTEDFNYDNLDRLTTVEVDGDVTQNMDYDDAGNITFKTGVGEISYQEGTNRISSISGGLSNYSNLDEISYTSFDKTAYFSRKNILGAFVRNNKINITYGPEKTRKIQEQIYEIRARSGQRPKVIERWSSSKYYIGNLYEKEVCDGEVIERNFIYANNQVVAISEMSGSNSDQFFYMHHDHIGSIIGASDSNGHLVDNFSYDAWGNRRNPDNYSDTNVSPEDIVSTDHGFTGHEHIDLLGLINMNGRIYDPILGRFLSPDPLVQAPDMTQSLNRYAYCLNNPLTLTDPSGYSWVGTTFAAITGIAVALETGGLAAGLEGAVISGALGGASAAMMSSVINGANFRQTAKNTYTGAFWGAFSSCVSYEIGEISNVYARIAAHTAAEGAMEGIRGGHVEHGMLVGFTSSVGGYYINRYGSQLGTAGKVAANAALSGVVAEIGGGKFASGAMTGAFIMMYNELQHQRRNRLFMCREKYKQSHPLWRQELRKSAFEYMICYTSDSGNEIAAAVLKNGNILVFDPNGNTDTSSRNYFVDKGSSDNATYVNIEGSLEEVAYQVHTHPYINSNNIHNPLAISSNDISMANTRFNGVLHILTPNGNYYKVYTNQLNAFEGPIKWR